MPDTYFPDRKEFEDIIESKFDKLLANRLPELIRRGTRKEIYTINEAAELLSCSRRHIYYLLNSGQLNHIQNGNKKYIRSEDFHQFFDRNYIENEG